MNDLYVEVQKGRERAKEILNRKDQRLGMKARAAKKSGREVKQKIS